MFRSGLDSLIVLVVGLVSFLVGRRFHKPKVRERLFWLDGDVLVKETTDHDGVRVEIVKEGCR